MPYKSGFIKFMCACDVLQFGRFTLKSGRVAPYFINTGNYKTGSQVARLGEYYAACIVQNTLAVDTLFGPAYKGIPLAVATAIALFNNHGMDVNYCFNRKEAKDHGEGGVITGHQPRDGDRVAVIEDVITAGTALRECLPVLQGAAKIEMAGLVISVDRMEKTPSGFSAVQEACREFGIRTYALVTINDIIDAITQGAIPYAQHLDDMLAYRREYGVETP